MMSEQQSGLQQSQHNQNPKKRTVLSPKMRFLGGGLQLVAKVFPGLVINIVARLWFMPMMGKPEAHIVAWQNKAQQHVPLSFGNDLHIFTDGFNLDAPLVLCVHGWRGRGFQFRRFLQPLIAAGYRVAVFDAPAHASAVNEKHWTTFYEFVDAIREVKKVAGPIDSVITHSFGSPATAFAIDVDFKPRKLAMISGNFDIEYYLHSFTRHLGFDNKFKQKVREKVIEVVDQRIFKGAYQNIHIDSISEEMVNIDTKFWYDPKDKEINIESIHQLATRLGDKPTQKIEEVGHFEILKSPELIQSVVEFLRT